MSNNVWRKESKEELAPELVLAVKKIALHSTIWPAILGALGFVAVGWFFNSLIEREAKVRIQEATLQANTLLASFTNRMAVANSDLENVEEELETVRLLAGDLQDRGYQAEKNSERILDKLEDLTTNRVARAAELAALLEEELTNTAAVVRAISKLGRDLEKHKEGAGKLKVLKSQVIKQSSFDQIVETIKLDDKVILWVSSTVSGSTVIKGEASLAVTVNLYVNKDLKASDRSLFRHAKSAGVAANASFTTILEPGTHIIRSDFYTTGVTKSRSSSLEYHVCGIDQ